MKSATAPPNPPSAAPPRRRLPPLSREERRAALEVSTVEGMFATAHSALSGNGIGGNVFSYGYALLLGATNAHLGLLTALPQIATAGQTLAAYLLQRVRSRRALVIGSCVFARSAFFLAPLLPFLLGREAALPVFIGLFGVAAFTYAFAGNAWTSWMADLVPHALRGRYFSRRSNLCNLVGLVSGLVGAVALDAYAGARTGVSALSDERRLVGFVAVFGMAAVFGGISTLLLRRQPEPERIDEPAPSETREVIPLAEFVATPFRDPEFRRVLLYLAFFQGVNGIGNPFWAAFVLEDLQQSMSFLTLMNFLTGVSGLLTLPLWGRAIDRYGAKPCLALAASVGAIHPLYFLIASPTFVLPIYVDAISSGIMWGGWNLAVFNLLLTVSPERRGREMYFAAHAGAAGFALATSSIVAGAVADIMPGGRRTLFAIVTALRLASLLLLARVKEPGARPLGEMLRRTRRSLFGV